MIAEEISKSYKEANDSWEKRANTKFSFIYSIGYYRAGRIGCGLKCALSSIIASIELDFCPQLSVNCSALQRDVVRKVCQFCDCGTMALPRK